MLPVKVHVKAWGLSEVRSHRRYRVKATNSRRMGGAFGQGGERVVK